jgi:hypothetical protein
MVGYCFWRDVGDFFFNISKFCHDMQLDSMKGVKLK